MILFERTIKFICDGFGDLINIFSRLWKMFLEHLRKVISLLSYEIAVGGKRPVNLKLHI